MGPAPAEALMTLDTGGSPQPVARYPVARDAAPQRARRGPNERVLKAVRPNAGVAADYERRLLSLIGQMERSVLWWVRAAYRANPPAAAVAQDDMASFAMARAMRQMRRRWLAAFEDAAGRLARYFADKTSRRSDDRLKKILRDGGFTVEWRPSQAQRDVVEAIVHENVALIKSIPQEALLRVEGAVMRSVQQGRDLSSLYRELREGFGVSRRRARLISRDQNNKATSMLQRARFVENGITECVWMHSSAGKEPRPSHVKAGRDRVRFDPRVGWFDPHEKKYIWPGTLINCRCTCRPVIKGFS